MGIAMLLTAVSATAAMPLQVQRRGELRNVIDLRALDRFGPIERVELIGPNVWRVTSGRCYIDVTFVERPGNYPGRGLGPPQLEPHAGRQICSPLPR
jgi:hypothetical protein